MVLDVIYIGLYLAGLQTLRWRGDPGGQFIAAYGPVLWWIFSAVLSLIYPVAVRKTARLQRSWPLVAIRLVALLLISILIDFCFYRLRHPQEFIETSAQAALYFIVIPSLIISTIGASVTGMICNRKL